MFSRGKAGPKARRQNLRYQLNSANTMKTFIVFNLTTFLYSTVNTTAFPLCLEVGAPGPPGTTIPGLLSPGTAPLEWGTFQREWIGIRPSLHLE